MPFGGVESDPNKKGFIPNHARIKVILTSGGTEGNLKAVYDTLGTAYQLQQAGVI